MVSLGSDGLIGILAAFETTAIRVRPRQCTRLRHRKSTCARCADVCPSDAITWTPPTMQVDAGKCSACGLCVAVCPTGALEGKNPTSSELVSRARDLALERPAVAFACKTHLRAIGSGSDRCVQVNCLGRLDESVLAASIAWGAQELLLADGTCRQCPVARGRSVVDDAVVRSRRILDAFGSQAKISFVAELPLGMRSGSDGKGAPDGPGVSRRDFFEFLMGRAKQTGVVAAEAILPPILLGDQNYKARDNAVKPGELPVYQGVRRRLLLTSLARLGAPKEPIYAGEAGFWLDFRIAPVCDGCRMCALFCPTGALSKTDDEEGRPALSFAISKCTGCGVCRDLCFRKAVELPVDVDLRTALADSATSIPMPRDARNT